MMVLPQRPSVAQEEAETYRQVWGLNGYGDFSPGERYAPIFVDMVSSAAGSLPSPYLPPLTVLDAGTGTGKGAIALAAKGFSVTCCDFTAEGLIQAAQQLPFHEVCLWKDLVPVVGRYDFVVCCDVLEHIPAPLTLLAVHRMLEVSRRGLFLSIALQLDAFGAWLGKSLHQTVQCYETWKAQLGEVATVVEARDLISTGIYFLRRSA